MDSEPSADSKTPNLPLRLRFDLSPTEIRHRATLLIRIAPLMRQDGDNCLKNHLGWENWVNWANWANWENWANTYTKHNQSR